MIADQWGLSREDLDTFAPRASARRERPPRAASSARSSRWPCATTRATDRPVADADEASADTTVEVLSKLKTSSSQSTQVTAGNSSQITDGASAVLVMSEEKASELGYTPVPLPRLRPRRRRPGHHAHRSIPAQEGAREGRHDHRRHRPDEINEAFASVVLAWRRSSTPTSRRST